MTELEKAAREYAKCVSERTGEESTNVDDLIAFKDGAEWHAKQSPWITVSERTPEDSELVLTSSSIYGTKLLVWNDHYKVWDDEDGDDVYCDRDKIDAWMPIPE